MKQAVIEVATETVEEKERGMNCKIRSTKRP
jgi:hypothetical protein